MLAAELLRFAAIAMFGGAFAAALLRLARCRDCASADLVFLSGAATITAASSVADPGRGSVPALVATVAGLTIPYLLLRVARTRGWLPVSLPRVALAALAIEIVALLIPQVPRAAIAAAVAASFVIFGCIAGAWFAREAALLRGAARQRLRLAAAGSGLAVVAGGLGAWAAIIGADQLGGPRAAVSFACAVCFLGAFTPPRVLRRAWHQSELSAFLVSIGALSSVRDRSRLIRQLEEAAARAFGSQAARIELAARGPAEKAPRTARSEIPAETAMRVPIDAGRRRLGSLTLAGPRAPVFAEDDIEVARLLADAIGRVLRDHDAFAESRQRHQALSAQAEVSAWDARHDTLTGLANRVLLRERLDVAINVAQRERTRAALLVFDLDGFKEVNDSLGHAAGDELLRTFAQQLRAGLREADVVARLGGDEFAIVLSGHGAEGALTVAQQLLARARGPFTVQGHPLELSASAGLAFAPDDAQTAAELLHCADVALYAAKTTRGGVVRYDDARARSLQDGLTLRGALRSAVASGIVSADYQPVLTLAGGHVAAVEALARWPLDGDGGARTAEYVAIAERSGIASGLTAHILRTALRDAARPELAQSGTVVSVNLTARDLADRRLVSAVREALDGASVGPDRLMIELPRLRTEDDERRAAAVIEGLREAQVGTCLDDVSAGIESIDRLRRIPVDLVKLDRASIHGITADGAASTIVRATISASHDLGVRVAAKYVEDQETSLLLRSIGCDLGQGNYLAPPMPAEALAGEIAARSRPAVRALP